MLARYNGPWTPWFMRRNGCGIDVTGNQWVERLTDQATGEFVLEMRNSWLAEKGFS